MTFKAKIKKIDMKLYIYLRILKIQSWSKIKIKIIIKKKIRIVISHKIW